MGKHLVLLGENEQRTFNLKRLWDWLERSVTINSSVTSKYAVYELAWPVKSPAQEGSAEGDNNRPQRHWYPSTERQLCTHNSNGVGLGLAMGFGCNLAKDTEVSSAISSDQLLSLGCENTLLLYCWIYETVGILKL